LTSENAALIEEKSRLHLDFIALTQAKEQELQTQKAHHEKELEIFKNAWEQRFEEVKRQGSSGVQELTQEFLAEMAKLKEAHAKEIET